MAESGPGPEVPTATLGALLAVFLKLGMTSFGGGLSGWIHGEVVRRRAWMTEEQFIAGVALTQVMPGPNAVNLALFVGQRLRGAAGLAVCGFGILAPPFLFILALAAGYGRIAGLHGTQFVLSGMAAAGVGMTFTMGLRSARHLRAWPYALIGLAVFVAVGLLEWPMLPTVAVLAPLGVGLAWVQAGVQAGVENG